MGGKLRPLIHATAATLMVSVRLSGKGPVVSLSITP